MIVGVPRESFPGERRVALTPAVIPSYAKAGVEVVVETGAGMEAGYPDPQYAEKGAKIVATRQEAFAADVVVQVLGYGSNDKTGRCRFAVSSSWSGSNRISSSPGRPCALLKQLRGPASRPFRLS